MASVTYLQHWIKANKVERTQRHTYLPVKDVPGFYPAPVPLEFPGKSGDSFIRRVLLRNCPVAPAAGRRRHDVLESLVRPQAARHDPYGLVDERCADRGHREHRCVLLVGGRRRGVGKRFGRGYFLSLAKSVSVV
jgi:hypothetical protein